MAGWQSYPFGLAIVLLFLIGMLRGQATYWIARTITEQTLRHTRPPTGWRARVHGWLSSDTMGRGRGAVQRYGLLAVPLCYLTVGVQTVVLASSGVFRMRWLRFTLAQSIGALAWAVLYSTVGFAFWAAFFEAAVAGGPGAVVGVAAVVALTGAVTARWYVQRRRRRVAAQKAQHHDDVSPTAGQAVPSRETPAETDGPVRLATPVPADSGHDIPR